MILCFCTSFPVSLPSLICSDRYLFPYQDRRWSASRVLAAMRQIKS